MLCDRIISDQYWKEAHTLSWINYLCINTVQNEFKKNILWIDVQIVYPITINEQI